MTKLSQVLAEKWTEGHAIPPSHNRSHAIQTISIEPAYGAALAVTHETFMTARYVDAANEKLPARVAAILLGKRALALVLKHEWCGVLDAGTGEDCCPECGAVGNRNAPRSGRGHEPGCEWGDICDAARRIG